MLPWAGLLFMGALSALLFWRYIERRAELSAVGTVVGAFAIPVCFGLGGVAFEILSGVRPAGLQERALDFDTVPVCFRTSEVAPVRTNPHETGPKGLFCCRQAGDLSCVIDWRAPRLGIDDQDDDQDQQAKERDRR